MPHLHETLLHKERQFLKGPVQMFGHNNEVQRIFHACVKEGLNKSSVPLEEQSEQMIEYSGEGRYKKNKLIQCAIAI